MSAPLFNLKLYSNVRITRDYSVVHDMTPSAWLTELDSSGNGIGKVFSGEVNYYRLPRTIRLEANYDKLRKATYGVIYETDPGGSYTMTMERPQFFWVDDVRLLTAKVRVTGTLSQTELDVVELDITPDVWSNSAGQFELYDSFVVRRHVNRWYNSGSLGQPVYTPLYYPNAGDDVGGAYSSESIQDLTPEVEVFSNKYQQRCIIVSVLDNSGKLRIFITMTLSKSDGTEYNVLMDDANNTPRPLFSLKEILNGKLFSELSLSAQYVQSILVVPVIKLLYDNFDTSTGKIDRSAMFPYITIHDALGDPPLGFEVLELTYANLAIFKGLCEEYTSTVTAVKPSKTSLMPSSYDDKYEPMLYRAPARLRKITTGSGESVLDIPDLDAFIETWTQKNYLDLDTGTTAVYSGSDIETANAKGSVGTVAAASLPIYESAWKNYQAIQKTGDDIVYNAKQTSLVVGALTGAMGSVAGGAIAGATTGGPAGAAAGAAVGGVGSLISTGVQYWSNSENLRAKRETIRNSPCVVATGGRGLGAYIANIIDLRYMTLKLDDISMEKLRTQYYYYGYNINAVIPGTIDLDTRRLFDYIETRGARVKGTITASDASKIADIFDRGVRIYHDFDEIGNGMSKENYENTINQG